MSESRHTQGPLIVLYNDQDLCYDIVTDEPDGHTFICDTRGTDAKANALRLCKCWNSHDTLLDVLRQIKILNAGKDNDINWLCIGAAKLVGKEQP